MPAFGFLNISKPQGWTSHDVIAKLRKSLAVKKIGHSGTLDPFATGVLVIGLGHATRLFEYISSDKVYAAEITFGIETDTNDITGKIIKEKGYIPEKKDIVEGLKLFTGKIKQKPPVFSAVKLNGKRAYSLARKNKLTIEEMKEKDVEIYSMDLISCLDKKLTLKIHCSSGTYIRSIARDLGSALNTCAVLSGLERIKVGSYFTHKKSISPEILNKENYTEYIVLPQEVINLGKIKLNPDEVNDIFQGKYLKLKETTNLSCNKELQILDTNNNLVAIGLVTSDEILKPRKVFIKSE